MSARHLANMRVDIADPRPLPPNERTRRADLYLIYLAGASRWTRFWSMVLTWHLDKVDRAQIAAHIERATAVRRQAAQRRRTGTEG